MPDWFATLDPQVQDAIVVIGVGALTNTACALLGCYLVLRRMSLLSDALAHAVLPGLVVAFVLAGSLNVGAMFAGAIVTALLTTFLTQALHRQGGVAADASMGVVFTSLFALGVVLIKRYGQGVDLDVDCVLFGEIMYASLDTASVGGREVPRALVTIGPVLCLNVLVIIVLWKELKLSSFDDGLATTMGFNAHVLHYLLMALVALTTVASFEQVGSILVIAMFIVPGATAHLLTDRLSRMMWISAALACAAAAIGYWIAVRWNIQAAGPMAVTVGAFYVAAMLAAPRYGVLGTMFRNMQASLRVVTDDLLAMLYRLEELRVGRSLAPREATEALGAGWIGNFGVWSLARRAEIESTAEGLRLTDAGRRRAVQLVRSHRLWEAWLVEHLGLPPDHVHAPAERVEHYIDERLQRQIVADLSDASLDPHGREIPQEGNKAEG